MKGWPVGRAWQNPVHVCTDLGYAAAVRSTKKHFHVVEDDVADRNSWIMSALNQREETRYRTVVISHREGMKTSK